MKTARPVIHFAVVCLLLSCSEATAGPENSHLWWQIAPTDAYPRPEGLNYDIFPEGREVPLRFVVENSGGDVPMRIGRGFHEAISISLRRDGGGSIAMRVSWKDALSVHSDAGAPRSTPAGDIPLQPGDSLHAELALTPEHLLEPGIYELLVDMSEAGRHVMLADGTPWTGRVETKGSIRLHVQSLTSAANRARSHLLRADRALLARDAQRAILHYTAALNETGPEFRALGGLGRAYFAVRDYARSVDAFERALPLLPPGARTVIHQELACAYVGLKDRANATRVLRLATSEQNMARAMAACEKAVGTR